MPRSSANARTEVPLDSHAATSSAHFAALSLVPVLIRRRLNRHLHPRKAAPSSRGYAQQTPSRAIEPKGLREPATTVEEEVDVAVARIELEASNGAGDGIERPSHVERVRRRRTRAARAEGSA